MTTISVSNGQTAVAGNQYVVENGGVLTVSSGVTISNTQIQSGGSETVLSGGTDNSVTISAGGNEVLSGTASGDQIYGTQTLNGSVTAIAVADNETVYAGGAIDIVLKGAVVSGAILSGGAININGSALASNTTLDGGSLIDLQSNQAHLTGTVTFSGVNNEIELTSLLTGPAASAATLVNFASGDTIVVSSAGVSAKTSVYAGSGTLVGDEIATVSSGGTTDTFVFANAAELYNSSTLTWTLSGTTETLSYTPAPSGVVTSVTTSTASGAYTETVGNTLLVLSGGSVSAATIASGGFLTINGGSDAAAVVSYGGTETVLSGAASDDLIYGTLSASGATAALSNETVFKGGQIDLYAGATASNVTLSGGGVLELAASNVTLSGALTFSGGGNELLISALATSGAGELAVISGLSTSDKIDVTPISFTGATLGFATSNGNEIVTVSGAGGVSESFVFSGTTAYTSATMMVTSDGKGSAELELTSGVVTVSYATGSGAYTVGADQFLIVAPGGSISAATVNNGGELIVSGGADAGSTVQSGGSEIVSSGGSATGDAIAGSLTVIGGTIGADTVSAGGVVTLNAGAIDTNMTLQAGATLNVSAATGSATLSGDSISGTVNTVSGLAATFTDETVYSGGFLNLQNSNNGVDIVVSNGGTLTLSGKENAENTVLAGGATVILESPKALLTSGTTSLGAATPALTFENGGNTLSITNLASSGSGGVSGTISGFGLSDQIVVSGGFVASDFTLGSDANGNETATVSSGGLTDILAFSGASPSGYTLGWTSASGSGEEVLSYLPVSTTTVSTSTSAGAYTVFGGDTLEVVAGGSVSAVNVGFDGIFVVSGGVDTAANVLSGGVETVSAGTATGDQIYGSAIVDGGLVSNEAVFSGGHMIVNGSAGAVTVNSGGVLELGGGTVNNAVLTGGGLVDLSDATATLTGTLTFSSGGNTLEVDAISNNGAGDQAVISGFSTSDKIDLTGISLNGASLTFASGANGTEIATVSGTSGSESFIFAGGTVPSFTSGTITAGGTMNLMSDGAGGVDLIVDTTPVVAFTSLTGLQTNQASQFVNGTVDVAVDPEAIGSTVTVTELDTTTNQNVVVGTGTVGADGYWSADVTYLNDSGANVLSASDTDLAGNTGATGSALSTTVNTKAAAFTAGNLVISVYGDGAGTGSYGLDQAAPIVLDQITTSGQIVSQIVLPETTTTVDGVTENAISGEYGSASEGTLELSADGHSLTIAGYGVNDVAFDASTGVGVYGTNALGQTNTVEPTNGQSVTLVPRVVADINASGVVDTSTALDGVFNSNNPRSVTTVNGSSFYLAGQGVKGDTTQGVFYATDGATSATALNTATDTRIAEIYNGQLYVSVDSTQGGASGTTNIADYGALPTTAVANPIVLQGLSTSVVLNGANGNEINGSINGANVGETVNLSPENFFFANEDTLYVADGGVPKNGGLGDGGLQKWVLNTATNTWNLEYTLTAGLSLVPNTNAATDQPGDNNTTGLIGLTGQVESNGTVELYATNETAGELDQSYLYSITDTLSATAPAAGESFNLLMTAAPDTIIRGIALAPTGYTPTISGTVANKTTTSEAAIAPFANVVVSDLNANATDTLTIALTGAGGTLTGAGSLANGVYTLTGTAAQITTALDAVAFTPTAGTPNTSSTTGFTLNDVSSADTTPAVDTTTTVIDSDPAVAPTITGTVAGQTTTSEAAIAPFANVAVGDANANAADTLTIALTGAGGTVTGAGTLANGVYTLTGTAAQVTTALDAVTFTPTAGTPNTSSTTGFTLSDVSSADTTPAVDTTTTVIDSDPAVAPTISGTVANQATTSEAAIALFANVAIGDANADATDTLTIALTGAGGTLTGAGSLANGVYTLTGTAAQVTTALDAVTFTPTAGTPNTSSTTGFTLSDVSSADTTKAIDTKTTVVDSDSPVASTISGTVANQTTTSEAAIAPFAKVTVGDLNVNATDTLTIGLSGAGGTLSGAGTLANGVYTLTGTAAQVTTALDAVTFTPNANWPNSSGATLLTLSDLNSVDATVAGATTTVVDNDPTGAISETAAYISANIDGINVDVNVTAITLTGGGTQTLTLNVAQALGDTTALGEITNAGYLVAIADTSANILPNIGGLTADSHVTSTTLTGSNTVAAAQAEALGKLKGFKVGAGATLAVSDSAVNLLSSANATGIGDATSVTLTGLNRVTAAQAEALSKLKGFTVGAGAMLIVIDTAANLLASANAAGLADATGVTLTDANTVTAANAETLTRLKGFVIGSGATLVISDSAIDLLSGANTAGVAIATAATLSGANSVSAAQAEELASLPGFTLASGATLVVSDNAVDLLSTADATGVAKATSVTLTGLNTVTAAQAEALSKLKGFTVGSGATLIVFDSAANLLSSPNAAGLAKATSVTLTGVNTETATQAEALSKLTHFTVGAGATLIVADIAANLLASANAAGLADATSVTLTGLNTATAAQAEALSKLNLFTLGFGATLIVADTAANLLASANAAGLADATSATLTGANTVTAANAEALTRLKGFVIGSGATLVVSDNAVDLLSGANAAGVAIATKVTLTGVNSVSAAQAEALASLPGFTLASGATLVVSDSAVDLLSTADAAGLAKATSVTLTGANTVTVAQTQALSKLKGFTVGVGATLVVFDSALDIEGLSTTQIAGLGGESVSSVTASDATVFLTVAQAIAFETAHIAISAPTGSIVEIADTALHLQGLTAAQISALPGIGVSELYSNSANVSYTSAQTTAILGANLTLAAIGSDTVTENFANGDYSAYQNSQLVGQKSVNKDLSYDIQAFDVVGQNYTSDEYVYNASGVKVAFATDNTDKSGSLTLYSAGDVVTVGPGQLSVTVGADAFALNAHASETIAATGTIGDMFVFAPASTVGQLQWQDIISGFAATGATHDVIEFDASAFGAGLTAANPSADLAALLSHTATNAAGAAVITDNYGDTLTLTGVTKTTLSAAANAGDFKFV